LPCPHGEERYALGGCSRSNTGLCRAAGVKIGAAKANSCVVAVSVSIEILTLTVRERGGNSFCPPRATFDLARPLVVDIFGKN
jgi:hypothetical protein